MEIPMAVPKKRTSKTKKNLRKNQWKLKASSEAEKALGKAKLVLNQLLKKSSLEKSDNNEKSDNTEKSDTSISAE
jgi:large subunit ribosomal protein L32